MNPSAASTDVVVTGVGLVTSLGFGVQQTWSRLQAGDSGISQLDTSQFGVPIELPVRIGAMISRVKLAEAIRAAVPRQVWNTSADVCHAWLLAALEALDMAGLGIRVGEDPVDRNSNAASSGPSRPGPRTGIFVGTGAGAATFTEQEYVNVFTAGKSIHRDISRMAVAKYMTSSLAGQLSILIGSHGPSLAINTACSSGATAIVLALDAIRLGRVDRAIVGGADLPLTASVLKGFANLSALSPRKDKATAACRPFDAARDGFVLGEGAACLVMERSETAAARAASPLAMLRGGAAMSEAYNLLAPREGGASMADCIREALRDAHVAAGDVGHVYSHGTGTLYNDRCEAAAIQDVLPLSPTVSATKSQMGHTLGAAGAIDAVLAVHGIATGEVVPCQNLETLDTECPINPARSSKRPDDGAQKAILVNSFAFGGHNTSLLFSPI